MDCIFEKDMKTLNTICSICQNSFYRAPWEIKDGRKYCRSACFNKAKIGKSQSEATRRKNSLSHKGKMPKNFYEMQQKAWDSPHYTNSGSFKKGTHPSPQTQFVKTGVTFKGTLREYQALHYRIGKKLGKPSECNHCGEIKQNREIDWANISGKYKEELNDWIRLCKKCHFKFDQGDERRASYVYQSA